MDRRRTAAPDRKKKSRHHEVDVSSGTQLFSRSTWEEGLKERDIWNVTFDFSPEHGDDEDANRHAVVEKRKTCSAKEFGPSQRSAGSLAGVHRHDPVTVNWKQRGAPTRDSPSQRRHRQAFIREKTYTLPITLERGLRIRARTKKGKKRRRKEKPGGVPSHTRRSLSFQGTLGPQVNCRSGPVVNCHAVIEKGKTCGAEEFQPSQKSAGSLAGVHRHDPVTVD